MIDLSSHIEFLLLRHDCVVVPGFGAFLVHESPAFYDDAAGLFMPPSRSLGFNPAVNHNDGLLIESVARKEGIGLEAALQNVQCEVSAFRHQLSEARELPIGSLGMISIGSEPDALLFEPATDSSVSLRFSGLQSVNLRPLVETRIESVPEQIEEDDKRRPSLFTLPLRIAASVISLLVLCGILYSTTNLVENGGRNFASLDSGLSDKVGAVFPVSEEKQCLSHEIALNIALPKVDEEVPAADSALSHPSVLGRYLLVVGSFTSSRDAERHISYIGEKSLSVLEMDGRFRIFESSFDSYGDALSQADKIRDRFPNVWICKR